MKRDNLEKRINAAIKEQTPDILEKILLNYNRLQKGEEVSFMNVSENLSNPNLEKNETKDNVIDISDMINNRAVDDRKKPTTKKIVQIVGSLAAAFVLVFSGFFAYSNFLVDYTIGLDVNPSLEISVNKKEDVLRVVPLNDDGAAIIDGMNLKGVDLNIAVNALIGSMLKHGYIDDVKNSILLSVENADTVKSAEMQKKLSIGIEEALKGYSVSGAILSQSVTTDQGIKQRARQYGISVGKVNLIDSLVKADATLKFEDLIGLSINDLNLVSKVRTPDITTVSSVGTASTDGYIGGDKALAAALSHAGVAASAVKSSESKLDYEDGIMVYEIEFYTTDAEYDYEIKANTGAVISFSKEQIKAQRPNTVGATATITVEKAKEIALNHAGLKASEVTFVKAKLDNDDGRLEYEVEFYSGNKEYDYEIDALTGAIISYDYDAEDYHGNSSGSSKQESSGKATEIGIARAKEIALNHAGLKASEVTFVKAKLDNDDGRLEYEVEFYSGNKEYDYEIDALTGAIISYDYDVEDYHGNSSGSSTQSSPELSSTRNIDAAKAKQIALSHAGVSESSTYEMKVEYDHDDGKDVYEVDFKSGQMEYEYEIDAASGNILKNKAELDD